MTNEPKEVLDDEASQATHPRSNGARHWPGSHPPHIPVLRLGLLPIVAVPVKRLALVVALLGALSSVSPAAASQPKQAQKLSPIVYSMKYGGTAWAYQQGPTKPPALQPRTENHLGMLTRIREHINLWHSRHSHVVDCYGGICTCSYWGPWGFLYYYECYI